MSDASIPHIGVLVVDNQHSNARAWVLTFNTHAQITIRNAKIYVTFPYSSATKPVIPTEGKNGKNVLVDNY